jgi:hypothetical protein
VNEVFQSNIEELDQILNDIKNFLLTNNRSIQFGEHYLVEGNKNFLQVTEETLNDNTIDIKKIVQYINLMKIFLEKVENFYIDVSLTDDSESLKMKDRIEDASKFMGFSGKSTDDVFFELKNTINRLNKKEIVL